MANEIFDWVSILIFFRFGQNYTRIYEETDTHNGCYWGCEFFILKILD